MNRDGGRWLTPVPAPATLADGVDLVELVGRPLLALVDGRWLRVRLVNVSTHGTPPATVDVELVVEGPGR